MIVYINTLVILSIIYDGPHSDYYFPALLSKNLRRDSSLKINYIPEISIYYEYEYWKAIQNVHMMLYRRGEEETWWSQKP